MMAIGRVAALALWVAAVDATMGGWAVITVENPPEALEAGATYRLEYTVRQHGTHPLGGLETSVRVRSAESRWPFSGSTAEGAAGAVPGRYVATITVPEADQVVLTVRSGFRGSDLRLLPIPVRRAGQPRPAAAPEDRGRVLFVAKGCGTCHVNGDVPEFARHNLVLKVGPDLTGRPFAADYVRQRLTDPASLPPIGRGDIRMPDLGLAPGEVDALVGWLSGGTAVVKSGG